MFFSLSFPANAIIQRRFGQPEPSPSVRHREHSHGVARKTSGSSTKTNGRAAPRPKPVYMDASTQTTKDNNFTSLPCGQPRQMRPPLSFKRKLLQQAQEDKLQRERMRSTSVKVEIRSPALKDVSSSRPSPLPPSPPLEEPSAMDISTEPVSDTRHKELTPEKEPTPEPTANVEMSDAEMTDPKPSEPLKPEELPDAPEPETPREASHPPTQPPAPPWSSAILSDSSPKSPKSAPDHPFKSVDLNVETPGRQELVTTDNNRAVTPGSTSGAISESTIARSPTMTAIASPFSPAVNNALKQPPARKKLSLSDYTNRNRRTKLAQTQSTGSSGSIPLAQSQSTSSPTLSAASLPNNNSPPPKAAEPILPPVAEEAKPAEVSVAPTIATTSAST